MDLVLDLYYIHIKSMSFFMSYVLLLYSDKDIKKVSMEGSTIMQTLR